jgi:D-glycero-alpha-D-manno-heptose 1-phosphate guanylyltransferase
MVLAGGFGSRLKTAVPNIPKALAPVGDVPFLQLQLVQWLDQGLCEFTFLLHHQAEQIISFLKVQQSGLLKNCKINWLIEPMPLDTGGAVAFGVRELKLGDDFLLANADTWLGGGVKDILKSTAPAIVIVNKSDVSRYGEVQFDNYNCVTAFTEKNTHRMPGWINAGLCHMHADLFKEWNGRPFSLERDLFPKLVKNRSLSAVLLKSDFLDIGVPEEYHRFCRWVEAGRQIPLCN